VSGYNIKETSAALLMAFEANRAAPGHVSSAKLLTIAEECAGHIHRLSCGVDSDLRQDVQDVLSGMLAGYAIAAAMTK